MKSLQSLALRVESGKLFFLDQRLLPDKEEWIEFQGPDHLVEAIKLLQIRGAPLIGVSAAIGLALFSESGADKEDVALAAKKLRAARPTAVNLMNALDQMTASSDLTSTAEKIFEEDVELCQRMSSFGAELIEDGDSILTHCNTGGLATAGIGTALGVIRLAHKAGKKIHVYVDETRPLLQGGRLTTWELRKLGIPYTLICDGMAASLMAKGQIQKIFVGADRIAMNGDFANKIGTYSTAVCAHFHQIPFYGVAPVTTIDPKCSSGADIPVEERKPEEVRGLFGSFGDIRWAPKDANVYNPAFDVTPASILSAIVLDSGVYPREALMRGALQELFQ